MGFPFLQHMLPTTGLFRPPEQCAAREEPTGRGTRRTAYAVTAYAMQVGFALLITLSLSGCGVFGSEDTTPPSAPSQVSAASGAGTTELEWSAPEASDLDGYRIYRSPDQPIEIETSTPLNTDSLVSKTSFTDRGVSNGTTYRYRVTAVDDSENESTPSDSVRVTPFADPPTRP